MQASEILKVTAATAGRLHVVASYLRSHSGLVDSKKQKLSYNQVLFGSIVNLKSSGQIPENITMRQAVATVLGEIGSKNVQTVQIGNSLFVGVFTPEKNNMYIRLYNIDVGRNVIINMYRYVAFFTKKKGSRFC